jgi:hypothetical protein
MLFSLVDFDKRARIWPPMCTDLSQSMTALSPCIQWIQHLSVIKTRDVFSNQQLWNL